MMIDLLCRKTMPLEDIKTAIEEFFKTEAYDGNSKAPYTNNESVYFTVENTEDIFEQYVSISPKDGLCTELEFAMYYATRFDTEVMIPPDTHIQFLGLLVYPNKYFVGCEDHFDKDERMDCLPLKNIEGTFAYGSDYPI